VNNTLLICSAYGALALALSPGLASADPAATTGVVRSGLGQPGYIVQKGEWLSTTSYSHQTSSSESVKATGDLNAKDSGYADTGGQTFTYGLTDHLSINLRQSYESTHSEADRVDGVTTDTHSQGLADPAFGVTWRALDQGPHPVSLDLSGSFAPNWFRAKSATTTETGTIAAGGAQALLSAAVTRLDGPNIFYGSIAATYHGSRVILIQSGPYDRTAPDYWSGEITAEYDRALTPQIDVSVTGRWDPAYTTRSTNLGGNGLSSWTDQDAQSAVTLGVNDCLTPDKVAVALTFSHAFDHGAQSYQPGVGPSGSSRHATSDTFGATLRVRL